MISARVMQNRNEDCVRYANNNYNICQTRHQDDKKGWPIEQWARE